MAANYDEVLAQLRDAGLLIGSLEVGRRRRVRVEGEGREKRGWYHLHEIALSGGDTVLVGAFGVFRGAEHERHKIEWQKERPKPDPGQRAAIRARIREDQARAEAERKREAERAGERARRVWERCSPTGESDYLTRKAIKPYGVRFSPSGAIAVPMHDALGRIHGLQFILSRARHGERIKKTERDKEYWPPGLAKAGHFFLIGGTPGEVLLLCEGYATGATLHEATGLPVAVAFDANNLQPAAQALAKRYRDTRLLICADDDYLQTCAACGKRTTVAGPDCRHCGQPHGKKNAGVECASAAALAVGGAWMVPRFAEDRAGRKLTDFNDLAVLEGLMPVRAQVEARIVAQGWSAGGRARAAPDTGEGGRRPMAPIESVDELLERFALVYGHRSTVFDFRERILMALTDMRDACTHRELHRRWMESPAKKLVRLREVGFDPAGTDSEITCNLWGGWPTVARSGSCEVLLELLRYLCSHEDNPDTLYEWVLRWLAYPIQHPGAKMKTALVLHGPQGAGKNLFFESVMAIYGEYGRVVDQNAIEDKFNDWASKKLFLVADEVVARQELYHTKNKLKAFITGDWIRINPKNVSAWEERNHVNLVFLSNETQPLVLERDDRRYTVIWTPAELLPGFYQDVKDEIRAGGIEALHHHLLNLDLGDFEAWTRPPMTQAKRELIDLSMDSTERFWGDYIAGHLDGVPVLPTKSDDLYELYRTWCGRVGIPRYAPRAKFLAEIGRRTDARRAQARYQNGGPDPRLATFVFPRGSECPSGWSQSQWLGECVDQFQDAVRSWREKAAPAFH